MKWVLRNTFFLFFDPSYKARILQLAPWNIRGFLLVLREWPSSGIINDLDFSTAIYWVQIHGFPLARRKIGRVVEVDTSIDSDSDYHDFMRVRVELDVQTPLSPGFYFRPEPDVLIWVAFKYERLSGLCYNCGCIDHLDNACDAKLPHPYKADLGPRMKVSSLPRQGVKYSTGLHSVSFQ